MIKGNARDGIDVRHTIPDLKDPSLFCSTPGNEFCQEGGKKEWGVGRFLIKKNPPKSEEKSTAFLEDNYIFHVYREDEGKKEI